MTPTRMPTQFHTLPPLGYHAIRFTLLVLAKSMSANDVLLRLKLPSAEARGFTAGLVIMLKENSELI